MSQHAVFIFDPEELRYNFGDHHPFNQKRLSLTIDLLTEANALHEHDMIMPEPVDEAMLTQVHSEEYVRTVRGLSVPNPDPSLLLEAEHYGLYTEDTPVFTGMHQVTSLIAGGSVAAADAVMSGKAAHALHLGGGLHHALRNKGAGFCVYNDASVAIAHIRERYHARVLYVDTDVHHGDGVQWSFYTDPDVCTFSIHETGKYLFPGTGGVAERGDGNGFGTSVNMPVEPFTEDESWLECFEDVLRQTVSHFKPDVIVSQHGCDAHAFDPLAHVHCSMAVYKKMPELIRSQAAAACDGRWVALGGGGYDIWRVVPRAWGLLWLVMSDHPIIRMLEDDPQLRLPEQWLNRWQPYSPATLPDTWLDCSGTWDPMPRRTEITAKNRQTKDVAMLYLR